jgi:hypothetical protein
MACCPCFHSDGNGALPACKHIIEEAIDAAVVPGEVSLVPQRFRPEHLQELLERSVSNKSQLVNAICYALDFRNCELGPLFLVSFVRHDQYGAAGNSRHEKTEK